MLRWLTFLVALIGCSGCGMVEDFVLGPDPAIPVQHAGGTCANGVAPMNQVETAEPDLLKR